MRRGQAMLEAVVAVVFISFAFLAAFQLAQMCNARILLDHAAARAARARAVGFNDFMCRKVARAAMIPVAGERLWPRDAGDFSEAARVPLYLESPDEAHARAILEYAFWNSTSVKVSSGLGQTAEALVRMDAGDFRMDGRAEIESHFPHYMEMSGL